MNNEIKINVPEGMEIDEENSTFECIKFKPKWIPKRGDIASTGNAKEIKQIILVDSYLKQSTVIGFDIECLAVLDVPSSILTLAECLCDKNFWILEEASNSDKELFIKKLNEQGYVYNPDDPRIIYKKEKELPKTWEEFCENNPIKPNEAFIEAYSVISEMKEYPYNTSKRDFIEDANLLPSKEYAEAILALCKLIQLRDCYNDGWKPDWSDSSQKHCIFYNKGNVELFVRNSWSCILVFKSRELRNKFYNNFKDLIEQAKLLL